MKISHAGLLGVMLTSAIAFSASAADLKGAGGYKDELGYASVNWSGYYAGFNFGGATNSDASGAFGGGQFGYNWQGAFGLGRRWVAGVEADFQGSGINQGNTSLNWFSTLRGRLGYEFGPVLVYGTGGFAFGELESTSTKGKSSSSLTDTQTGYVVGGGVEYKFSPVWSVKGEYQFISLDSAGGPAIGRNGNRSEIDTIRVGLNYRLGRDWDPLK
jgi:outer membrane immunogenic protein